MKSVRRVLIPVVILLFAVISAALVYGFNAGILPSPEKQEGFGYIQYRGGEDECLYLEYAIEDYLKQYASTEYSPEIAHLLSCLSWAAYNNNARAVTDNIEDTILDGDTQSASTQEDTEKTNIFCSYESMGFSSIRLNEYYDDPNSQEYGENNCAYTIGYKPISGKRNLIVIAIRGSYGGLNLKSSDWRSNFYYVLSENNNHTGFELAADKVKDGIEQYEAEYGLTDNVYIITGHSRGAAVGNLLTKRMVDDGIATSDIYNYNFACPNTTTNLDRQERYPNIFNVCNSKDIVTQMPQSKNIWGKYGTTLWYEQSSGSEKDHVDIPVSNVLISLPITVDLNTHAPYEYKKRLSELSDINTYEQEGAVRVVFDNTIMTFDQPPVIEDDRTMVPIRKIFEAMGAELVWNDETKTAVATREETTVSVTLNDNKMHVNDRTVELDVPAQILNGRTLVPLRAISEAFDCTVDWAGETRLVSITQNQE
ncbi:MAG: hypothetical protein IJH37_04550 [Clostridia bacterium]|nr:hypothetical protein [Clostridia bacterium]